MDDRKHAKSEVEGQGISDTTELVNKFNSQRDQKNLIHRTYKSPEKQSILGGRVKSSTEKLISQAKILNEKE